MAQTAMSLVSEWLNNQSTNWSCCAHKDRIGAQHPLLTQAGLCPTPFLLVETSSAKRSPAPPVQPPLHKHLARMADSHSLSTGILYTPIQVKTSKFNLHTEEELEGPIQA